MSWSDVLRQLLVFAAGAVTGGLVVYWTLTARARRTHRGETMTAQTRDRSKLAVALIGMSVILVVFGLQVRDSNERDRDYQRQADAFQAQQKCLNEGAQAVTKYLVDTLNRRVQANAKVTAAQKRLTKAGAELSAANTQVVLVVAGGFDIPPTASRQDLVDALQKFRELSKALDDATNRYNAVVKATEGDLDTGTPTKPYDPPKVACVP